MIFLISLLIFRENLFFKAALITFDYLFSRHYVQKKTKQTNKQTKNNIDSAYNILFEVIDLDKNTVSAYIMSTNIWRSLQFTKDDQDQAVPKLIEKSVLVQNESIIQFS